MKILFTTSECAPFSKSGGLADVAFSLPPALMAAGDEVAVITPLYQCVMKGYGDSLTWAKTFTVHVGWRTEEMELWRGERAGVTHWFVRHDGFYDRPRLYGYDDDKVRFAFFSRAVIDLLGELDFVPDILHCNDWETAPAVLYLKNDQSWRSDLQGIKSVYTIHNIAYQGQFGENDLYDTFGLASGWFDGGLGYIYEGRRDINLMKGAMLMANAVSTVSPTYARELHSPEFGHGLQGVVDMIGTKMRGILNGIDMDHYDPMLDKRIAASFSAVDMTGKAVCKAAIQEKFGLNPEPQYPLLSSVARLVEQKGIELVKQILPSLMEMGVQVIVYGQGDQSYIDYFNWCMQRWPGMFGFSSDYNETTAAQVFAGSDFYLMPSRFEPCGLSQMMAMRYGTIPIVHETGGLKDSVRAYSNFDGIGDGFSFVDYSGNALYLAILAAVRIYFGDPDTFARLRRRCMTKDFSWTRSAMAYDQMYADIVDIKSDGELTFNEAFERLKAVYAKVNECNQKNGFYPEDFHLNLQLHVVGRGDGVLTLVFHDGTLDCIPEMVPNPDVKIAASLDNLVGMAEGTVSADKLFMNGQMRVAGNVSRGALMRKLLIVSEIEEKEEVIPMNTTLLIMAAGLGSRYGGNKQVDTLGPNGEILMEYSIHDAVQAGFDKVVFVIKRSMAETFKAQVGDKVAKKIHVEYAFQEFDNLPGGFVPPEGRTKPYGTVHAVLVAKDLINEPFAVINADDYYGRDAFVTMAKNLKAMQGKESGASMVAYYLQNTVSENGSVTRGVCVKDADGYLKEVVETYKIMPCSDGTIRDFQNNEEGDLLDPKALVSMNFWGFAPSFFQMAEENLIAFLNKPAADPMKSEYVLPTMVDQMMKAGKMKVEVLSTDAVWFGVTYREDRPYVISELKKLHDNGTYPAAL